MTVIKKLYTPVADEFPMIPPQVNGATRKEGLWSQGCRKFPMIPPQVNGATVTSQHIGDRAA